MTRDSSAYFNQILYWGLFDAPFILIFIDYLYKSVGDFRKIIFRMTDFMPKNSVVINAAWGILGRLLYFFGRFRKREELVWGVTGRWFTTKCLLWEILGKAGALWEELGFIRVWLWDKKGK